MLTAPVVVWMMTSAPPGSGNTSLTQSSVLGAVSMKLHHRYTLDILEEGAAAAIEQ